MNRELMVNYRGKVRLTVEDVDGGTKVFDTIGDVKDDYGPRGKFGFTGIIILDTIGVQWLQGRLILLNYDPPTEWDVWCINNITGISVANGTVASQFGIQSNGDGRDVVV